MKFTIALFALVLCFNSFASTVDSRTFNYDGTQDSVELLLRGEKTHTEYRYEDYQTLCYRTEIVGYRTVCTGYGPNSDYGPYPRRGNPRPYPRTRTCYQDPIYRQISYPCIQTRKIAYEVKDFDVEATVSLNVKKLAPGVDSVEKFVVNLRGDELSLEVSGSKKFFITLKNKDIRSSMNGSVKFLDGSFDVELIEAAPVLTALKMKDLEYSFDDKVLTFEMGKVSSLSNIGFNLNVLKSPILGSNKVIFDRELFGSEIILKDKIATFDFNSLGIKLRDGRYKVTSKIFFKSTGVLLNKSQFGDLEVSQNLILKM
jgi:hypothetical protein